jgi:hypothetical protein
VLDTPATPAATILPPIVAVITPSNEVMDPLGGDAPIQQLIQYVSASYVVSIDSIFGNRADSQ